MDVKIFSLVILTLLFLLLTALLIFFTLRTWKTQFSPNQKLFLEGGVPEKLPDGFYKGKVTGLKTDWQGKKFDSKNKTGINIFKKEGKLVELYPFKVDQTKGLRDNLELIRIDYDLPENPLWVRFVKDEIVEVEKNKFLGKVHLAIIPGIPFSVGYFRLEK